MKLHRQSGFAETRTVRLSGRLSCTITVGPAGMSAEWHPPRTRPSEAEMGEYRRARDEMLRRLGERMGKPVLLVEV